jgi:hypothetical protein
MSTQRDEALGEVVQRPPGSCPHCGKINVATMKATETEDGREPDYRVLICATCSLPSMMTATGRGRMLTYREARALVYDDGYRQVVTTMMVLGPQKPYDDSDLPPEQ